MLPAAHKRAFMYIFKLLILWIIFLNTYDLSPWYEEMIY